MLVFFLTCKADYSHSLSTPLTRTNHQGDTDGSRGGLVGAYAQHYLKDMSYALTTGGAFSITDRFDISVGANLITDIILQRSVFTGAGLEGLEENYTFNIFGMGGALQVGVLWSPFTWFHLSANINGPGIGFGEGYVGSDVENLNHFSRDLRLPQNEIRIIRAMPVKGDIGLLFQFGQVVDLAINGTGKTAAFST